jgi:hypothetical protein
MLDTYAPNCATKPTCCHNVDFTKNASRNAGKGMLKRNAENGLLKRNCKELYAKLDTFRRRATKHKLEAFLFITYQEKWFPKRLYDGDVYNNKKTKKS